MWHYHKYLRFRCTCIYNSIYTNIYNIQCSYMGGSISCTWILSCMKYWTWKSSRRNESPNWSLRITSATVRPFHVTFNKTWIQWYTTEIKEESNSPANLLRRMSAGKAETQSKVLWSTYWADLTSKKKVLYHHDNAPTHTIAVAMAKLVQLI